MLNIVLVRPQIPHNTASIGRTCLNFGARLHLIGPLGFSLDAKEIKRAGLDYWPHVDLHRYNDWSEFSNTAFTRLRKNSYFLSKFGQNNLLKTQMAHWDEAQSTELSRDGPTTPSVPMDVTLVFGSETTGLYGLLGDEIMKDMSVVYMPMLNPHRKNDIPSFNLAASVAMVTWEAWRQQQILLESRPGALESWKRLVAQRQNDVETLVKAASAAAEPAAPPQASGGPTTNRPENRV